jgi:uncharacterized protein (TIGR03118 family)
MLNNSATRSGMVEQKTTRYKNLAWNGAFLLSFMLTLFIFGCSKDEVVTDVSNLNDEAITERGGIKIHGIYEVTNLVSDVAEYDPEIIDPNLVNAWGMALSPTGAFWISAADAQLSVIYDDEGVTLRPPVTMDNNPTGQVFNSSTGFTIPGVGTSRFIFVTEQGTITAWRTGNTAPTMVDNSASGASYTGVEIAKDGDDFFLYVANVAQGRVDVFDTSWTLVNNKPFNNPHAPTGSPFNIRLIDKKLYVTYVEGYETGGFVNIFKTNGHFEKRFATGGTLDAPWGITDVPHEFGLGPDAILIGNFADGKINIFDKHGKFKGQLGNEDKEPIVIDGLWALGFLPEAFEHHADEVELYFTAGPDDEEHGLFGEIEHEKKDK